MEQNELTEAGYRDLAAQPLLLVVIGRDSCDDCKAWREVLTQWVPESKIEALLNVVHLDLDSKVGQQFCRDHQWTEHISFIPFNVMFQYGKPVDQWPGGTVERLMTCIENED